MSDTDWSRLTGLPPLRSAVLELPRAGERDVYGAPKPAQWRLSLQGHNIGLVLPAPDTRSVRAFRSWCGYQHSQVGFGPAPPLTRRSLRLIRASLYRQMEKSHA